ncbi:MAG TPA: FadR/GntR family transcriptional regulator [Pseudonocardia sp.]|nr:FadR/GntR family transcriptional regulator [Pseudonocardia sp.]
MAAPMTERAIARIRQLIMDGQLTPGSRLPPEHELAALVGSSRNTTREAVRALVTARVLDVRRGDGTFVTSLRPELLLDGIGMAVDLMPDESHLELFEVRRVLEPAASELAAQRIDAEGVAVLRRQLELMRQTTGDPEQFVRHDAAFHEVVAGAAGNATMAALLSGISSRTLRTRIRRMIDEDVVRRTLDEHTAILDAIAARDPVLARAAATMHIATTEASLRRRLAAQAGETASAAS